LASPLVRAVSVVYHQLLKYALKFGVVGLLGYVVDVGIFNALRLGVAGDGHFFQGPIGAKIISSSIAILVTWFGNRYWTFREHRRQNYLLEFLEFGAIAVAGMGINLLCLYVSHYVLGHTSLLADNISANVIGLFIATAFRFVMYRFWVYAPSRSDGLAAGRETELSEPRADTRPIEVQP
jgi:putative flippase GtrA